MLYIYIYIFSNLFGALSIILSEYGAIEKLCIVILLLIIILIITQLATFIRPVSFPVS